MQLTLRDSLAELDPWPLWMHGQHFLVISYSLFFLFRLGIIPVVYGLGPYKSFLPPKSYIDVFDFNSVEKLATYLKNLSENATAYNEYFRLIYDCYVYVRSIIVNHKYEHFFKVRDCQVR